MSCLYCNEPNASKACGDCKDAFYCGKDCQKNDWPEHFEFCEKRTTTHLTKSQRAKFRHVWREYKAGHLHSGSKQGPIVRDRDQALAIAYAEAKKIH